VEYVSDEKVEMYNIIRIDAILSSI